MKITVYLKYDFGSPRFYPVNTPARALAQIAGTITLTPEALNLASHRLGLTIEEVRDPKEVRPWKQPST